MRLFNFCKHHWETVDIITIYFPVTKRIAGTRYDLRCKKCGDIKSRKVLVN